MNGRRVVIATLGLLGAIALGATAFPAPPSLAPDHGHFRILLQGQSVGTEEFSITRQGIGWRVHSVLDLHVPGQPPERDSADLELTPDGSPLRYHWQGVSQQTRSLDVGFRAENPTRQSPSNSSAPPEAGLVAELALHRPGTVPALEAFRFPQGRVVLLDNNVYVHYAVLARLYDWQAGGAQKFSVLIPQDQTPGAIVVESQGERILAGAALTILEVKSPDLVVEVYLDAAHRLVRLAVPSASAEIVRQ